MNVRKFNFGWLFGVILCLPVWAVASPRPVPSPPTVAANNYILVDYHSGRILAEKESDVRIPPASLTKLMTAFVVFNELRNNKITLDEEVLISAKAWRTGGSRMFVEVNTRVKVEDLLKGMIIQSGNDASVALAEHIAGTEETFAAFMNQYARELGMTNTHFTNSSGLPHDNHFTTARDLAILVRNLIQRFPDYYEWYSERSFTYNNITQHNRNRLLWRDSSVDGLKTGYTETAGYCLISSAEREGMRLVSVLLGAKNAEARLTQSLALLNYGFRFFETRKLYQGGVPQLQARIWKGVSSELKMGLKDDLYITIPRGEYDKLQATTQLSEKIEAPVQSGEKMGSVSIHFYDEVLAERPLIALDTVQRGGVGKRVIDSIKLWFH